MFGVINGANIRYERRYEGKVNEWIDDNECSNNRCRKLMMRGRHNDMQYAENQRERKRMLTKKRERSSVKMARTGTADAQAQSAVERVEVSQVPQVLPKSQVRTTSKTI